MVILSAEYGIIRPEDEIEYYDRRITSERAKELRDQVLADVERVVRGKDYDEILVNAGKEYAIALEGIEEVVDTKVTHIQGQGIGEKGNDLKYQVLEKNPSVELSGGDG